jgi:hypothetical protein
MEDGRREMEAKDKGKKGFPGSQGKPKNAINP